MVRLIRDADQFLSIIRHIQISENPFFSYSYYKNYISKFLKKDLFCLVVYDSEEKIIGLAPFVQYSKVMGVDLYRFVGHRKSNYLGFICSDENVKEVYTQIEDYFIRKGKPSIVDYYDINSSNRLFDLLYEDECIKKVFLYQCPYLKIIRNWSDLFYSKIKGSKKRAELNKFERKLRMLGNIKLINIADENSYRANIAYIDQIFRVHSERFEDVYVTSGFSNISNRQYYSDLIRDMVCSNKAFLSLVILDDVLISFVLCLVCGKTLIDWVPAFDPAFSKYSLGTVHLKMMFEYLCDHTDFEVFDFSKGSSMYKERWADGKTENYRFIKLYHGNLLSWASYALYCIVAEAIGAMRQKGIIEKVKDLLGKIRIQKKIKPDEVMAIQEVSFEKEMESNSYDTRSFSYKSIYQYSIPFRKKILDSIYAGKKQEAV